MPLLFDTHAHLNLSTSFPNYLCLNVTTCFSDWKLALAIHHAHNNILPALGIHPWFVDGNFDSQLHELEMLLEDYSVFALGEIGLDFRPRNIATKTIQTDVCQAQLILAERFGLPISVHVQKAHNEMLRLLKLHSLQRRGVIHGLGASREIVASYIDLGYKIGINAVACRSNARRYHEMINYFDLDHFVLETDYPNISNARVEAPKLDAIHEVAKLIASVKKLDLEQVYNATYSNAIGVFYR